MQGFFGDSRKLTVLRLQLLGGAAPFPALKTQRLTKQSRQQAASRSRAHARTSSGIPSQTRDSTRRMYFLQQCTVLSLFPSVSDSQTMPENNFYFNHFCLSNGRKPKLSNLRDGVSPSQQNARCGSASPAELAQRGSWPGRSHTQTNLEVHSDRNKDGS